MTAGSRGIALMLIGCFLFSLNDALGKWLVASHSVAELLLLRSLAAFVVLAPLIRRAGRAALWPLPRPGLQAVRLALVVAEVAAFYWAVRTLPLADIMTIYMAAPLFVTALSVPLLGERVGLRRWTAVCIGFVGILLILRPTGAVLSPAALVALAGSILFALSMVATRALKATNGIALITWQTAAVLVTGAVAAPFTWSGPGLEDALLLASLGIASTWAHMCVNRSLQVAPAAVVVPFQYTMLVWAVVLGYFVFGDSPGPAVIAGALVIVGSGLYVFHREQRTSGDSGPAGSAAATGRATDALP